MATRRERAAYMLAREDSRRLDSDRARTVAAERMADRYPRVRLAAAIAYIRLGGNPAHALPPIAAALHDPQLREHALTKLELLGPAREKNWFEGAEAEYEALFAELAFGGKDEPGVELLRPLAWLQSLSGETAAHFVPLLDSVSKEEASLARSAIEAARELGPARELLLARLDDLPFGEQDWVWLAGVLMRDAEAAPEVARQWAVLLDNTQDGREGQAWSLIENGSPNTPLLAEAALPRLAQQLNAPDSAGRALRRASAFGAYARPLATQLARLAQTSRAAGKASQAQAALMALERIDPQYPGLTGMLKQCLADEEHWSLRAPVCVALLRLGDRSPELLEALTLENYMGSNPELAGVLAEARLLERLPADRSYGLLLDREVSLKARLLIAQRLAGEPDLEKTIERLQIYAHGMTYAERMEFDQLIRVMRGGKSPASLSPVQ